MKRSFVFMFGLFSTLGLAVYALAHDPVETDLPAGSSTSSQEVVEDTPVQLEEMPKIDLQGESRPWRPPNFNGQEAALGYAPGVFDIPKGMEERVAFWRDIYTKYTTDQGVLHDSRYVHLVYGAVDFSDIEQDSKLDRRGRAKARRKRVDQAKRDIRERLKRLASVKGDEGLEGEDLRVYRLFASVDEPKKFLEAARRGRLRFQLGQRDRMIEGIFQSGRHLEDMEEIFRREGLPLELTRLPFVESSFNLKAASKVGASGIWQFMRSTARLYMRMDDAVDERNDPLRATQAAARKLKGNFQMLGSWPLAITAYNHGPAGVQRLVKKMRTDQIVELTDVRRRRFGFASANFFATFLAALEVERNAPQHFGEMRWMEPLRGVEYRLQQPITVKQIIDLFDGNLSLAKLYNPHIREVTWKRESSRVPAKNFLRLTKERPSDSTMVEARILAPVAAR